MLQKFKENVIWFLATYRRNLLLRIVRKLASQIIKGLENYSYNSRLNGEERVMAELGRQVSTRIIFDVGAHHGEWSTKSAQKAPQAKIYGFEPVPNTFAILKKNVQDFSNIFPMNEGLSDHTKSASIFFDTNRDAQSTLFSPSVQGNFVKVECKFKKGDEFCKDHEIQQIDFLKIDVEGAEHLVLKGFHEMLSAKRISCIQFEYGNCNKLTHFLLLDFFEYLKPLGFVIGKIYPDGVDFRDYRLEDENFIGPNFLAVLRDQHEMVENLRTFAI